MDVITISILGLKLIQVSKRGPLLDVNPTKHNNVIQDVDCLINVVAIVLV